MCVAGSCEINLMTERLTNTLRSALGLIDVELRPQLSEALWKNLNEVLQDLEMRKMELKTEIVEMSGERKVRLPTAWAVANVEGRAAELMPKLRPRLIPALFALIEIYLELGAGEILIDDCDSDSLSDQDHEKLVAGDLRHLLGLYPGELSLQAGRPRPIHHDGRWQRVRVVSSDLEPRLS